MHAQNVCSERLFAQNVCFRSFVICHCQVLLLAWTSSGGSSCTLQEMCHLVSSGASSLVCYIVCVLVYACVLLGWMCHLVPAVCKDLSCHLLSGGLYISLQGFVTTLHSGVLPAAVSVALVLCVLAVLAVASS